MLLQEHGDVAIASENAIRRMSVSRHNSLTSACE
jgi:hypothetical protein